MRIAATSFPHRKMRAGINAQYVMDANRDFERALAGYTQARQGGGLAEEGRLLADLCNACRRLNMLSDALDWGERAVAIAGESGRADAIGGPPIGNASADRRAFRRVQAASLSCHHSTVFVSASAAGVGSSSNASE
ncbi:hypothetical protein [Saccharopolyspora shandongensis]|uniref:hypothetical protein n=1 Tax=Saccharopolyspora shandongensis TaxID=418495 RepID=UPI0033EB4EAA